MERTALAIYLTVMVLAVIFFGAVHTYAYTAVFLGILVATTLVLVASVDRDPGRGKLRIRLLKTGLNPLFLLLLIYLIFQAVPLPESIARFISPGAVAVGQKSLPASAAVAAGGSVGGWFNLAAYGYPVRQSIIRWIAYGLFFWGFTQTLNSRKRIELAIFVILITGAFEALYGFIESFSGSWHILWFKRYTKEISGTYINRNHFAGLMEMSLLLMAGFAAALTAARGRKMPRAFGGESRWKAKLAETVLGEQQLFKRTFIVFSGAVMGMGLIFSGSKGGMIAVSAGMLVMGFSFLVWKNQRRKGFVLILLVVITGVLAVQVGIDQPLERFKGWGHSLKVRTRYVRTTMEMYADYSRTGVGVGNFRYAYPKYQAAEDKNSYLSHAHNDWAQFMAEAGAIGLGLLLIGIFYYAYQIIKALAGRKDPFARSLGMVPLAVMVAMAVHANSDFNLHIPANCLIFAAILAIGFSALHNKQRRRDRVDYQYHTVYLYSKGVWVVCLFTGLVIWTGVWTAKHFAAETHCNTVLNATLNRDQKPAPQEIKTAIAWDGSNAQYWYKLALELIRRRDEESKIQTIKFGEQKLRQAQMEIVRSLERAVNLNPFEVEYHVRLGWEYSRLWLEPDFAAKWFPAADMSMERAAYFAGEKYPMLHVKLGHYWVMRSKVMAPLFSEWKPAWNKACWHYHKALEIESDNKSIQKGMIQQITSQVQRYYPDEAFVKEALGVRGQQMSLASM